MKKYDDAPIDFVIPWVDGEDPAWRRQFLAVRRAEGADASEIRFRDWRNLRYWFRGVERLAPWVRRIHFITWGHLPAWLNTDRPYPGTGKKGTEGTGIFVPGFHGKFYFCLS